MNDDSKNPILEAHQELTSNGKKIVGVFFDSLYKPAKITVHCNDDTTHEVKLEVSHDQFIQWWKHTAAYVKMKRGK